MTTPADLLQIIEARRLELGLTQSELEHRAFGKGGNTFIQSLKKGASPAFDRVAAVARVLELDCYFGRSKPQAEPAQKTPEDFVQVPLYNAQLAAGSGSENGDEVVVDSLAFRRDWMRKIGVSPASAVLARIEGDSMQPTIWAGDLVLIDCAKIEIPIQKIGTKSQYRSPVYAVLDDGKARVKRIERPAEDQVLLISDNPDYGPQLAKIDSLSIIGKVMWWGHTNRE